MPRFTEYQIIAVLKSVEAGRTVKDVCRIHCLHHHINNLIFLSVLFFYINTGGQLFNGGT
ncbi:transposase [Morganella morganii]